MRAILLSLIFLAGTAFGQADWSYPVDPYFGVRHTTEYPNDSFPSDVNIVGPVFGSPALLRMGDPDANWTYWPYPTYYWWDALKGPGLLHGAWPSVAMLREAQGYNGNPPTIEFVFDAPVEDIRVRLVGFPDLDDSVKINGEKIDKDKFTEESTDCQFYHAANDAISDCTIYQAIVEGHGESTLYVEAEGASILKISSVPAGTVPPTPEPAPDPTPDSTGGYFPSVFEETNDVWNSLPSGKYKVKIEIKDSDGEQVSKETIKIQK